MSRDGLQFPFTENSLRRTRDSLVGRPRWPDGWGEAMSLFPVTSRKEVEAAYRKFARSMKHRAKRLRRYVGWRGGGEKHTVYWHVSEGIWCLLKDAGNRYSCGFGTENPLETDSLSITVEINPPYEGVIPSVAGLFVQDNTGVVYLAHKGKLGGGRKGITGAAFMGSYRGSNIEPVAYAGGQTRKAIVIGRVDSDRLLAQIAHFVCEVGRFKALAASGKLPEFPSSFTPEFSGKREAYSLARQIEAKCDHGLVTKALQEALEQRGHHCANDRNRDLYVATRTGRMSHLFEVKTDTDTSSLYQGVGQLMLLGAGQRQAASKRILVVPGSPSGPTLAALARLRINVVQYDWQDNRIVFVRLKEAIW